MIDLDIPRIEDRMFVRQEVSGSVYYLRCTFIECTYKIGTGPMMARHCFFDQRGVVPMPREEYQNFAMIVGGWPVAEWGWTFDRNHIEERVTL